LLTQLADAVRRITEKGKNDGANGGQNIPHHNLPEVQPELLGPYQAGYTRFWAQPQEPEKNATGPAIVKSHLDEIRS
jgi:hypothetical protein